MDGLQCMRSINVMIIKEPAEFDILQNTRIHILCQILIWKINFMAIFVQ